VAEILPTDASVAEPLSSNSRLPPNVQAEEIEELFARYYTPLVIFIDTLTEGSADAPDLAQEALISANRALNGNNHPLGKHPIERRRLTAWMYTIARNGTYDHQRRGGRHQTEPLPVVETDDGPQKNGRTGYTQEPGASDMPFEDQVIDRLITDRLWERILKKVTREQAQALALVDREGYSYDEAASMLGVPTGTLRSRLARGRQAAREILMPYVKAEHPGLLKRSISQQPVRTDNDLKSAADDRYVLISIP
jgi:RNA polymerase sigma factor (sigma-70 family)